MYKDSNDSPRQSMEKQRKKRQRLLIAIAALVMLVGISLVALSLMPSLRSRINNRLSNLRTQLIYMIKPPAEEVFIPEEQHNLETMVAATMAAFTPTPTSESISTATQEVTTDPTPSLVPTITPTPLPGSIDLRDKVTYIDQHGRWNYCGPANLTMALKYWGWEGNRDQVAEVVKPGPIDPSLDYIARTKVDKNVMPYEMVNFVNDHTQYRAFYRYGGNIGLIKNYLANGYPVLIEKGYYEYSTISNSVAWMGHYLFITGYDDIKGILIVQDAYLLDKERNPIGKNYEVSYDDFTKEWRYFNYLFMMVYPPEVEAEVFSLLGPWIDQDWANRHALDVANQEITELDGLDEYFAWYNKGTSHVQLYEYVDAAFAYDYAFLLYQGLTEEERPWRNLWYQTGPYFAYYYSGRYNDVINLANTTLEAMSEPTLEESFYWRGMARLALGETGNAVDDFKESVRLNPNFSPGWAMLDQLGVEP